EPAPDGAGSLLEPVMQGGKLLRPHPSLASMRERCAVGLRALPDGLRALAGFSSYPVRVSAVLRDRRGALSPV
ncbi:MAG: hypothetical protein ACREMG_14000, partial [Gemmatimonadales bacterium]